MGSRSDSNSDSSDVDNEGDSSISFDDEEISSEDEGTPLSPCLPSINRNDSNEPAVREPIARIAGTLVSGDFHHTWRNEVTSSKNDGFHPITDYREIIRQQARELTAAKAPKKINDPIENLFMPPRDLMFIGSWEGARSGAMIKKRWLLVNLQKSSEFACACLNRDIWKNETVHSIVKNNFFFWQAGDDSSDCKRISAYYSIDTYPTIMMIDPRTGEMVKFITRFKNPDTFIEDLTDFLGSFPDFKAYDTSIYLAYNSGKSKNEEELERTAAEETIQREEKLAEAKQEFLQKMLPSEPPASGVDIITIRLRLPKGEQQIRRFRMDEQVRWLIAYCGSIGYSLRTHRIFTSDVPKKDVATFDANKTFRELKWPVREQITIDSY